MNIILKPGESCIVTSDLQLLSIRNPYIGIKDFGWNISNPWMATILVTSRWELHTLLTTGWELRWQLVTPEWELQYISNPWTEQY